eukprot:gene33746-43610_t
MQVIGGRFFVEASKPAYQGEMAEVLCAYDSHNGMQKAAIKLFRENFDSQLVTEAFSRECESLEKLNANPNIITLLDFGRDVPTGRRYIALEWAECNLLEHIRAGPEPTWDEFYARYGRAVLDALNFAYSRDIIHRDVKPQNILIDNQGGVRVADFGISKFRRYYRPGVTLAQFKSEPYAPEIETAEHADARDVFGFAVLCLECVSPADLRTYEEVYRAAESGLFPTEIEPIIRRAIERQPELRHQNVVELREELEAAVCRREAKTAIRRDVPVHLTQMAIDTLRAEFQERSTTAVRDRLFRELNEICGIDQWPDAGESGHLVLLTAEFRFRAVVDEVRQAITVIQAARSQPSRLDRDRERAWSPDIRFLPVQVSGDERAIAWFTSELEVFLSSRKTVDAQRAETELFDRWSAILRFKGDLEEDRKCPIHFTDLRTEGARLELKLRDLLSEDITGEDRLLRVGDGRVLTGLVERVSGEWLTLYCAEQDLDGLPKRGEIVADTRLAESAIKRQQVALDALRFGRSVRPELRELLIGKAVVRPPLDLTDIPFFQDQLDEDKKAAIASALGAQDILVVEGPPGTGKTKFITELIAQFLRTNPDGRILLSSQTHNALDHALNGVGELAQSHNLNFRAVRIARRGDPRVSPSSHPLLLENGVQSWLSQAAAKSDAFLSEWASRHGISDEYVREGLALADLRSSSVRFRLAQNDAASAAEVAGRLREREATLRGDPQAGDEYRALLADLRRTEDELQVAEEERTAARRAFAAAKGRAEKFPDLASDLDTLNEADMESLEAAYFNHAPGADQFRQLLSLSEEWRQRFGRSTDFHGAYLAGCHVVAGTCIGVATQSLQNVEFDLCIIDEASKATPTEILVPMTRAKKWIVVGDPKQLPPFVDDAFGSRGQLEKYGLNRDTIKHTLLDHLISEIPAHSRKSLLTQHRMIKPIGDLVSHCFYDGTLNNVNVREDQWLSKSQALPRPVTWFTTSKLLDRFETNNRNTVKNFAEIRIIKKLLYRIQLAAEQGDTDYSVALLSGYAGQVRELGDIVASVKKDLPRLRIECGTVDAYQGREADIAVYSITRSNSENKIGFLREYERLNVALSRAKVGLGIVGDSLFCESVAGKNPMRAEEVAALFDDRAGYRLIDFEEVGLPAYRLTSVVLTLQAKHYPAIDEFVLRAINAGLTSVGDVAGFLGVDDRIVEATASGLIREDELVVGEAGVLALTRKSLGVLAGEMPLRPKEQSLVFHFDGLTRRPLNSADLRLLAPRELRDRGVREIRPFPPRKPEPSEIDADEVQRVLLAGARRADEPTRILQVQAVTRGAALFIPAVMLIYRHEGGEDVRVAFAIDGRLSDEHERKFLEADGPARIGIVQAVLSSPTKPPLADVIGSALAEAVNAAMDPSIGPSLTARREAIARFKAETAKARGLPPPEEEAPQEQSPNAEEAVRPVPVYEHPKLLDDALATARSRLIIVSPWITDQVADANFLRRLRVCVQRGVRVHIGYGIGDDGRESNAIRELRKMAAEDDRLVFKHFGDTHAKVLIKDNDWFVTTSFNWLSFRGDPKRTFREEWGTQVALRGVVAKPDNQDAFAVAGEVIAIEGQVISRAGDFGPSGVTFFVADGVGGSPGGRWAADRAVTLCSLEPQPIDVRGLENMLAEISRSIREEAPNGWRPATTLCGMIVNSGLNVAFNVGDSRVYGFSGNEVFQLSSDHRSRTVGSAITRFLGGSRAQAVPDVFDLREMEWSAFLMCSDGFYEELQLRELRLLTEISPPDALLALSAIALELGSQRPHPVRLPDPLDHPSRHSKPEIEHPPSDNQTTVLPLGSWSCWLG